MPAAHPGRHVSLWRQPPTFSLHCLPPCFLCQKSLPLQERHPAHTALPTSRFKDQFCTQTELPKVLQHRLPPAWVACCLHCAAGRPSPVIQDGSTQIQQILPIENGINASLFWNWPSFRKCSGLKVFGVSHSSLSNITDVKFGIKTVP